MSRTSRSLCAALVLVAVRSLAHAHGGGLDGYGCHHNRKAGGYHCHQGPMAGRSFSSEQEMLDKLPAGLLPYSAGTEAAKAKKRPGKPSGSIEARLRQLDTLHRNGLLTEEEYTEKRRAILDDM